jgi:methyl-accepting chemotaxis protein
MISVIEAGSVASGGAVEAELATYLPHLGRMGVQLQQTSAQIEEAVVEVCASFQGIASRARATVARTTGFLGDSGGGSSGKRSFDDLIQSCGATLVKIMGATAESGEISRRAVERIQQMDKASQQISLALAQLETIANENKMLALNARIEAAHAGSQGAGFAVVAVEVASQTQKSRAVTTQVGGLVDNLRALAESTLNDLQMMNQRDLERVEQCRREVDNSLRDLQAAHGEMKETLTDMTEDGALLAGDIGSAVRGMQFQDRVSQRIAHVVEDLETLRSRLVTRFGTVSADMAAADDGFSEHTMLEERQVAGGHAAESGAGDVELF